MTIQDLLQHFYDLRAQYRRRCSPKNRDHEEDLQHIEQYVSWCQIKRIPPKLFMEKRFEAFWLATHKRVLPRISQLQSDKLAELWSHVEGEHYEKSGAERLKEQHVQTSFRNMVHDLQADPLPYQERVKSECQDDRDQCIAMQQYSGGYHPKSLFCKDCSRAALCASKLQDTYHFDVVSLRLGRFHTLPNHVLSAALN